MDNETKEFLQTLVGEMRQGFAQVNEKLVQVNERLDRIEAKLGATYVQLGTVSEVGFHHRVIRF